MSTKWSQHLSRVWKSVPLLKLHQGSTLSVRSNLVQPIHVRFQPQWRDNGQADMEQYFSLLKHGRSEVDMAEMVVKTNSNQLTSLGRMAAHVSIDISPERRHQEVDDDVPRFSNTTTCQMDGSKVILPSTCTSSSKLLITKVALDNDDRSKVIPHCYSIQSQDDRTRIIESGNTTTYGIPYHGATVDGLNEGGQTLLTVLVPEKVNLICCLENGGGSITIDSKIEGDVQLSTCHGDINVTKLRGQSIELVNQHGTIFASTLLEAQKLVVTSLGRFRAKQVFGHTIDISVQRPDNDPVLTSTTDDSFHEPLPPIIPSDSDDEGSLVDISALFVSGEGGARICVSKSQVERRAVRVKTSHGPVRVYAKDIWPPPVEAINAYTNERYPIVELGGINGNCEVSLLNTQTILGDEMIDDTTWSSCLLHVDSLSPGSVSLVILDYGNLSLTLDRKVEADLRLLAMISLTDKLVETGDLLAEEERRDIILHSIAQLSKSNDSDARSETETETEGHDLVSIETPCFTEQGSVRMSKLNYVDGHSENLSDEPESRFDRNTRRSAVGKIRVDAAEDQALYGFSAQLGKDAQKDGATSPPLLAAIAGRGRIVLETMSWIGAIARRYGQQEYQFAPGRTAARRGRRPMASPPDGLQ